MRRIVRANLVRSVYSGADGVSSVSLCESGIQAKLRNLSVRGVPQNGYVIDLDASTCTHRGPEHRFPQFSSHFCRMASHVNKICDSVLVWEQDDAIHAALVDLKSTAPKFSATRDQLLNSSYFLKYVHSLLAWRDGETRPLTTGLHYVMVTGSKRLAGGADPSQKIREGVYVHGVSVDSNGRSTIPWTRFF